MNLLSRLRIRTKLASIVALAALTVAAMIAITAVMSENRMLSDRVAQMHTAVDILVGMAQTLQDDVTAGKLTVADAQAQFRARARKMTFGNGQGYPVVYAADSSLMLNVGNPAVEGKITGAKDSNGVIIYTTQKDAANASSEGGVASFHYPRPGETIPVRKMVYVRNFAPWNAVMSYGLYVDDIDADVNALLWRLGEIGGGLIVLMGLVSWLIARDILGALDRQKAGCSTSPMARSISRSRKPVAATRSAGWRKPWKCCGRSCSTRAPSKPSRSRANSAPSRKSGWP